MLRYSLKRYVPLENLKIRFTLGSNIEEVYTDKTGYYAINNKLIDNQATVSFVFSTKNGRLSRVLRKEDG